jgi:hypothetical protein
MKKLMKNTLYNGIYNELSKIMIKHGKEPTLFVMATVGIALA